MLCEDHIKQYITKKISNYVRGLQSEHHAGYTKISYQFHQRFRDWYTNTIRMVGNSLIFEPYVWKPLLLVHTDKSHSCILITKHTKGKSYLENQILYVPPNNIDGI